MMRRLLRLVLLVAGAAVLFVLVRSVGLATIGGLLRQVGWAFALVAVLYFGHVCVRAAALWRSIGRLRFRDVLHVRLSGEAIEMLTFTGPFLAEPAKGVLLTRRGLEGADAFGGVAIEYLLYTLTSTWMATIALSLMVARGVLPHGLDAPVRIVVIGMIVFTAGFIIAAWTGVGLIVPVIRRVGAARFADRVEPIERILITFMHERPARLAEVIGLEFLGQAMLAAEIFTTVRVLGYTFSSLQALLVEGAVKFISIAFFFVPGQIGAQESIYTLLFESIGLPGAIGLTMALVRRVRALIVAGIALAVTYWI